MSKTLIITCYFGTKFSNVYPAPGGGDCVLFSNNPNLRKTANRKGWIFHLLDSLPQTSDVRESSIQSKYVKFLQFRKDIKGYSGYSEIIYFDHKFKVELKHVAKARELMPDEGGILIRKTPREKNSIYDEIEDAEKQPRYSDSMPETKYWVEKKLSTGYSPNVRIMNTGLIYYKNPDHCQPFVDEVYQSCVKLKQPECQIFWAILSQKNSEMINVVPWSDISPKWEAPQTPTERIISGFRRYTRYLKVKIRPQNL